MNKPHFADIARDLTEGIASGRYPVGIVPADRAGTARPLPDEPAHDSRRAARDCSNWGLSRGARMRERESNRRSRGTTSGRRSHRWTISCSSAPSTCVWCNRRKRSSQAACSRRRWQCPEGARWLRISSLRIDGGQGKSAGRLDRRVYRPGLHGSGRGRARSNRTR